MLGRVVALALLTFSNRGARGEAPLWVHAADACEKLTCLSLGNNAERAQISIWSKTFDAC